MKPKQSHKRLQDPGADAIGGDRLIEVRHGEGAIRDLRSSLLRMSYQLAARGGDFRAYLVLDHPSITPQRLRDEWDLAHSVLRPAILDRLTLCVTDSGRFYSYPRETAAETQAAIAQVVNSVNRRQSKLHDRGSSWFVVTKVLIANWLRAEGPITTDQLMRKTGYSYPTIAGVLRDLKTYLDRTSDRRVSLRYLPRDLVERWLLEAARVRRTIRFGDRSRTPRSPEGLAERLSKLGVAGLAVGGVLGAKHYYPALDLVGAPHLDISQHLGTHSGLEFVNDLDPALVQVDDPLEPARLVVHGVTEADARFEPRSGGLAWASPLECVLDLHEAKLPAQASQLLEALKQRREIRA